MDKKHIIIAGGTGLIGRRLRQVLVTSGYSVSILSRQAGPNHLLWDPDQGLLDGQTLEHAHAIINLSGANIAGWLWTKRRKNLLLESRLRTSRLLVDRINQLSHPPALLINGSAIGYYPDLGDHWQDESAAPDHDFMGQLCQQWEASLTPLRQDVRRVWLRTGLVLDRQGGILPRLSLGLRLKVGAYFGDGGMYYSWIHIDDVCNMILQIITHPIQGPVNAVAPNPVTMKVFMQTLIGFYHPALLVSVPSWVLKLVLGDFSQALLKGGRIRPARILADGYRFRFADLTSALKDLVTK